MQIGRGPAGCMPARGAAGAEPGRLVAVEGMLEVQAWTCLRLHLGQLSCLQSPQPSGESVNYPVSSK